MLDVLLVSSYRRHPSLAYYWDWNEALASYPRFRADAIGISTPARLAYELLRRRGRTYDLILFPYGFFYDTQNWKSRAALTALDHIRGKRVFFLENEYRSLNRKLAMALLLSADFLTTQLPLDVARRLYAPFVAPERIVALPHGLSPRSAEALRLEAARHERELDLDATGDPYPFYLGHQDRQQLARFFQERAERWGLRVNVALQRGARMERTGWLRHLCRCYGALHPEAGSDFVETNDATRDRVIAFGEQRPDASFEEVYERFFRGYVNPISGRAASSRHFDAIGTRTCQIMFRGRFNDLLEADVHYIALERDFSNAEDVVRRFKDRDYRDAMTARAYDYALAGHTIEHRITELLKQIGLG